MKNSLFIQLRQKAEAMLSDSTANHLPMTQDEIRTLVHDLSVHQIELELQNEELLRAQQQIEKARDELARLYHNAPAGYLTLDRNGIIERCNRTFANMLETYPDELFGRSFADLLSGEDRDIFLGRFRPFFNQPVGKTIDLFFPLKGDQNGFYGRLTGSIDSDTAVHPAVHHPKLFVIVQDITEQQLEAQIRIKAEMELKNHDVFLATLLETVPIPIFYKDTRLCYQGCNRAYRDFKGLDASQIIGKTIHDIASPDIAVHIDKFDRQLLASPGCQSFEYKIRSGDNSIRNVVFNKATFNDAEGQPAGIVCAIMDVTELKDLQTTMQQARDAAEQANRAKSEFLANMSHELRTPMNGVIGMAELLTMSELTEEQFDYANVIKQSGLNLVKIIGDILDLSKIEANRMELDNQIFSLRETIDQTVNLIRPQAQAKGLSLFSRIAPELPDLYWGDQGRFNQVLLNILGNAIKFTRQGSVSIMLLPGKIRNNKTTLNISISDTGIGIPQTSLHKLFIPFSQVDGSTTRRFGGTGLGLAISRQLVELMGGNISVESSEGKGTTFFINLPLEVSQDTENECKQSVSVDSGFRHIPSACRILLVEDNELNQRVMSTMLKKIGYQTELATNGTEALSLLREEPFDLVLMDCTMPGLDGYETTSLIRNPDICVKNPRIPIIALTARAMQGDREKCLNAGMDDYLSKPVYRDDLTNVLNRWLNHNKT